MRRISIRLIAKELNTTYEKVCNELIKLNLISYENDKYVLTTKGKQRGGCYGEKGVICFGEKVKNIILASLYPGSVEWYCDNCGERLDKQKGFNLLSDYWKCRNCGFENDFAVFSMENETETKEIEESKTESLKTLEKMINEDKPKSILAWIDNHKAELITIIPTIGATAVISFFCGKYCGRKESSKLIKSLENKIIDLVDLCETKDVYYDRLLSDALKHGSSLAGKQMAFKKEYIKSIK